MVLGPLEILPAHFVHEDPPGRNRKFLQSNELAVFVLFPGGYPYVSIGLFVHNNSSIFSACA